MRYPRQRAHADQVVVYHSVRHSHDKEQVRQLTFLAKGNAVVAPADAEHDLFDQLRPRMRKSHAVPHESGMHFFAREHFGEKLLRVRTSFRRPSSSHTISRNASSRVRAREIERDVLLIENIREHDSHFGSPRNWWIIPAKAVIQLTAPLWQTKTLRRKRTPNARSRSSGASTIPGTSMRCRIFTGANSGASWSGGSGSTSRRTGPSPRSTAIITIAFSNREVPHIIFFFNLAIVWGMLWIEARRYRFYDAFRARVRMLEAHFLVPMVMENRQMLQGEWKKLVCEDLILPRFKISKLEAIGRRLKRNYVFIFILIMVAWVTKIFLHASEPVDSVWSFYRSLSIGHIPSWLVAFIFAGTFAIVIGITIYVGKKTTGEISEFGAHRSLWKI